MTSGFLVIGDGTRFDEYRGLGEAAVMAAANGAHVLCLAAENGSWPMSAFESADEVAFRAATHVRNLDKVLDAAAWRSAALSQVRPGTVLLSVSPHGWPWLEATWPSGGRFVYCGLPVARGWDHSPDSQLLLLRILERLSAEEE